MKKGIKVMLYLLVVAFILTFLYNNFYSQRTIVGKVIEFSNEQESRGNVVSILVISFMFLVFIIVFTFKNILDGYFDRQYQSLELDRMTGKIR